MHRKSIELFQLVRGPLAGPSPATYTVKARFISKNNTAGPSPATMKKLTLTFYDIIIFLFEPFYLANQKSLSRRIRNKFIIL